MTARAGASPAMMPVAEPPDINVMRRPRTGRIGLALVLLALVLGLATYLVLTGLTPIRPTPQLVWWLVAANGVMVLLLALLIARQVIWLVRARRRRLAGAGLHGRIVGLLSLFAAVPAIIVALFASVTLNRGLDAWFSERIESIVRRAIIVSEAYIQDKVAQARVDVRGFAREIEARKTLLAADRPQFLQEISVLAAVRGVPAVFILNPRQQRLEAAITADERIRFRPPPPDAFRIADEGKVLVTGPGPGDNFIRAMMKLEELPGLYVLIYRAVDPEVIRQLTAAQQELNEFLSFKKQRFGIQVTFAFVYAGVAFIFLLAAIWFGMWLADRLVAPVVGLIGASRQLARGNFDVQLPEPEGQGDVATLLRVFNRMTRQLKQQRQQLLDAYHELDERRRFMEAVLAGVSAGVMGLDAQQRIRLLNRSARELLGLKRENPVGRSLEEVVPAFAPVLEKAKARRSGFGQDHVRMEVNGEERTFMVRAVVERGDKELFGYVITFDDTTELLTAQRNAAWADVARRIAHEIKNPLTPIQLSAERLRRRFGKEITSSPEVFAQCTDTIVRQVEDIGRMVDEFSSFARMPQAHPERQDIVQVIKEALLLQRVSSEDIRIELELPDAPLELEFDRRLITQALTNLVKNAREAIEARREEEPDLEGRIIVRLVRQEEGVAIQVIDNGKGLPKQERHRLTEPYMTTRKKGTGLGLAIVQRIMEEHGGRLELADAPQGRGAMVSLWLPLRGMGDGAPDGAADAGTGNAHDDGGGAAADTEERAAARNEAAGHDDGKREEEERA